MKIKKYELVRVIDKVKSVVQKNMQRPALGGILIKEGYGIAANGEITIQVKLEGAEEEAFIIPSKAFDLIKSLPEGEIEINCNDNNIVTIRMDKIKNSYQSFPAEEFIYQIDADEYVGPGVILPGKMLMESINHVLYAAADKYPGKQELEGIYFEGDSECLNLAATDGHVMCWDQIKTTEVSDLKLIVPKTAAKKITSMGMDDDVMLFFDKNSAIFKTDNYVIHTRIYDGKYIQYQKMFMNMDNYTIVNRDELIGAMTRAKMCTDEKTPVEFAVSGSEINVVLKDTVTNYQEKVALQEPIGNPIRIGFDSRLVLETIKAFTCDNVTLNFSNPFTPMIVQAEDSDMKALVLPVRLGGASK